MITLRTAPFTGAAGGAMPGRKTENQERILAYIKKEVQERGYPPSVREICEAVGLKSTSTVHSHLVRLEKRGLIRRDLTKPRAIEITEFRDRGAVTHVPIIGQVAAGQLMFAQENYEGDLPISASMLGGPSADAQDYFALSVKGESMINAGIFNGDYVVVQRQESAHNGEIVVALWEDSATVKRFYKENDHIRLQPENDTMEPIIVPDVTILGRVVGLYRTM
jgi:repressor LexA